MNKTLRDIVKENQPDAICDGCDGGVNGCPQFYIFLGKYYYRLCHEFEFCNDCWNQKAVIDNKYKHKKNNRKYKR